MNNTNYDLKRHVELLNQKENILNQNKSFMKERKAECLELDNYNLIVFNHVFWQDRFEVALLMQNFLNKKLNALEFHDHVFGLRRTHLSKYKKFRSKLVSREIKEFIPNKEAYKLQGFLSALYFQCESFEDDWDEERLYNNIRNGFLNFQKVLNENYRLCINN